MQTFTGRRFYPADPKSEDVDIIDIAQALGHMTRYNGHCRFYSVAEHSVAVSRLVPEKDALWGLMHDASEAYIADVISPVKRILGRQNDYFKLEDGIMKVVTDYLGLPSEMPESVKYADAQICVLEKRVLHPRSQAWDLPYPEPTNVRIRSLPPEKAVPFFLMRYAYLTGANFGPLFDEWWKLYKEGQE
jgi:hypothetical protein